MEPYLKLQGGHSLKAFRVLLLQPGEWGDPIHCQLIHTALGRASEYQALSVSSFHSYSLFFSLNSASGVN